MMGEKRGNEREDKSLKEIIEGKMSEGEEIYRDLDKFCGV